MGVKEFLKPDKKKILVTFLLFGMSAVLTILFPKMFPFYWIVYLDFFPILIHRLIAIYTLIILALLAYIFSCYINKSKKWIKWLIFYLIAFIIISKIIYLPINMYNTSFGYSCNADVECHYNYHIFDAVSDKYILVPTGYPYGRYPSIELMDAICKNNRCEVYMPEKVSSVEDCEKLRYEKASCYKDFSQKLNDPSICDKIEDRGGKEDCLVEFATSVEDCEEMISSKSACYLRLAYKLKNFSLCNKVSWEGLKEQCILELVTSIKDCERTGEFQSKCYLLFAQKLNDPSICDKIGDETLKNICKG